MSKYDENNVSGEFAVFLKQKEVVNNDLTCRRGCKIKIFEML